MKLKPFFNIFIYLLLLRVGGGGVPHFETPISTKSPEVPYFAITGTLLGAVRRFVRRKSALRAGAFHTKVAGVWWLVVLWPWAITHGPF